MQRFVQEFIDGLPTKFLLRYEEVCCYASDAQALTPECNVMRYITLRQGAWCVHSHGPTPRLFIVSACADLFRRMLTRLPAKQPTDAEWNRTVGIIVIFHVSFTQWSACRPLQATFIVRRRPAVGDR